METEFLVVDYTASLIDVSQMAMNRIQESLYHLVVVTKQDQMYGVVSIRELIIKLSEIRIDIAKSSNPLSGLPGNNRIEETLQEVLSYKRYSVFYIDIDLFKAFNDTFGFTQGDKLIKETAAIISDTILTKANEPSFVGHIGGDDFIAVIPHYHYEELCETIIERFDSFILSFYTEEEIERGYIQALNRKRILENIPLTSISIAVKQNRHQHISSVGELSQMAAKVKESVRHIRRAPYISKIRD